jgi:hypothetical protein
MNYTKMPIGVETASAVREDLPVVDSLILDCPPILRVHRWHRVNNKNNPKHRVVFGVRFNGNLGFDKVVSAFADISRDQLI